ncbi:MAG: 3-deoxy-8-phosphooctulonate synthase [Paracoccaceae bacterium]|jgi:2-dehydro-3-deoxyphosphooctonate aldolase (KDO 8-P synthase)|nr:3-deoxy-8-phosphooctulonate synthase [Paracoccaceae bacterium]
MQRRTVKIGKLEIGANNPIVFITGPCQLESRDHAMMMAEHIAEISSRTGSKFIFKSSYDKANRSSISSTRGIGMQEGLRILQDISKTFDCPVITDIHEASQCDVAAQAVDVLQIPAFLCRQTDLLIAAGNTGKPINVKKGQFLAPWDMWNVSEKIASTGNANIMLCERGTSFGYNTLVNDFRGLQIMAETGYPVIFDATHSVQQPSGRGNTSGGERQFVSGLARAACAMGVSGIFIETHQDPDSAPCDGPNMIPIDQIEALMQELKAFDALRKGL